MPLYEYECTGCHRRTEKIQKFSDPELTLCPHCGGRLDRTITAAAISFKGGGWYKDGYASAKPAASSEGSGGDGSGSGSDGANAGGGSGTGDTGKSGKVDSVSASAGSGEGAKSSESAKPVESSKPAPVSATPASSSASKD